MRRAPRAIPVARSAVWTRRLALAGALLALAAVALPGRDGQATPAVMLLGIGLLSAALAIGSAAVAAIVIWRTGFKGAGRVLAGLVLSGLTLAYPAYCAVKTVRDAPAADISTDKDDPPQFAPADMAAGLAPAIDARWLLARGKPLADVEPIAIDTDPAAAYRTVLKTATQLRWRVVAATAPTPRAPTGHVDAVTYSTVMRLPVWIAIRIAPRDGGSRVDLRAVAPGILPLAGDDPLRAIQAFADAVEDQDSES